jgi:hypothetical protein
MSVAGALLVVFAVPSSEIEYYMGPTTTDVRNNNTTNPHFLCVGTKVGTAYSKGSKSTSYTP